MTSTSEGVGEDGADDKGEDDRSCRGVWTAGATSTAKPAIDMTAMILMRQ